MKKVFYFLASAALLFASCAKEMQEETVPEQGNDSKNEQIEEQVQTVLTISSPEGTKTTLGELSAGERQIYWANGDKVCVNGVPSDAITGIVANTVTSTDFSFASGLDAPYKTVYPSTIWKSEGKITLPYETSSEIVPLAGKSETSSVSLSVLTSMLKISLKLKSSEPDTDDISYIEVVSKDEDTQLSGDFSINPAMNALTPDGELSGNNLKVRINGPWTLEDTAKDFFIPIPAGTYNITVRVVDVNGHYMTKSTSSKKEFVKGEIKALTAFEYSPIGAEVRIASAEDLNTFTSNHKAGSYDALGANLYVVLANDITFNSTTSSTFNTVRDSYTAAFAGTFDGAGHTISGLSGATAPLFYSISGTVKDLTLDGDYSYTQANAADYFGTLAKLLSGQLSRVTVNADISIGAATRSKLFDLGGLIGRANNLAAFISNCQYNGDINIPSGYTTASSLRLGGLVGYTTKALTISDSYFGGTIKCLGHSTKTYAESEPGLEIGGIVGRNQKAIISGCGTIDAISKASVTIDETLYSASILVQSSTSNFVTIGGIVGFNYDGGQVTSTCTNRATIFDNITTAESTLDVGGVVGFNSDNTSVASVSGAENYAVLTHLSSSPTQHLGGVIGYDLGNSSNCTNETSGSVSVSRSVQTLRAGGVIGEKAGGELSGTVCNKGVVGIGALTAYGAQVGGVIGKSSVVIDGGTSKTITNTADISITSGNVKFTEADGSNEYGLFLGGIVGYATNAVKNVSNGGDLEYICNFAGESAENKGGAQYVYIGGIIGKLKAASLVDVEYCTNTGNLTFDPTSTAPHSTGKEATYALYFNNYLGGIVGYAELANIKGDSSKKTTNSGIVKGGDNSGNNNTAETFWVGGIVGKLTGASSSITYCELTGSGQAINQHWSNKAYSSYAPMCGGIAGEVLGGSANHAAVTNCTIANTANVVATRGDMGGIVGYARYADISNCTIARDFSGQSGYCYGGIVGWLRDGLISSCTFSGSKIRSSQMQVGGGIVGYLQAATIDGCNSDATDVSKNGTAVSGASGGIAGLGASSNTANNIIKNCHYKPAITLCGNNFTEGTGSEVNVADR